MFPYFFSPSGLSLDDERTSLWYSAQLALCLYCLPVLTLSPHTKPYFSIRSGLSSLQQLDDEAFGYLTSAILPYLLEYLHFDVHSTEQKSFRAFPNLQGLLFRWRGIWLPHKHMVTSAIHPYLLEYLHFDVHSTEQKLSRSHPHYPQVNFSTYPQSLNFSTEPPSKLLNFTTLPPS